MPADDQFYANFPDNFQNEFKALYEDAPLAYQSLGKRGEILLVNNMWLQMMGYDRAEVVGRPFADFLTGESKGLFTECILNLQVHGCNPDQEFELVKKNGDSIPVRIDGRVVLDSRGDFLRTHCIVQDMHTEVDALKARDVSEGRYRRLVELAREGIWEIDAKAHTVYANPAMATMLGYTVQEMTGMHLFDFMDDRGRKISERNLARRESGIDEQHDFEFITKSGRRIITTMETSPLFDNDGTYTGALAGVIDVTERRLFEQEMRHTQKLESLGVLAGGIAHDFNNLLQAVIGNAELAMTDIGDNPAARESLREIQLASQRATDLCRQMLAYAGRTHFKVESIDFARLVREMSEILKISLSKKADFEIELDSELPLIEADASQLGQVVMNLITNASEALGDEIGTVRIAVHAKDLDSDHIRRRFPIGDLAPGPHIVLEVSDTGCGMDDETRDNIFDPFFTTKFAGRGLGLAAVQGIIKGHNGAINVDSVPGQGTTIRVVLPTHAVVTEVQLNDPTEAIANAELQPLTILVAEDEESVRRVVQRLMERLGQKVHMTENGREAVAFYEAEGETIDLVLLDLSMPVMDGKEAMKAIRARNSEVPIIICSGFPAEDITKGFGSDQPEYFLQKPFVFQDLKAALVHCSA